MMMVCLRGLFYLVTVVLLTSCFPSFNDSSNSKIEAVDVVVSTPTSISLINFNDDISSTPDVSFVASNPSGVSYEARVLEEGTNTEVQTWVSITNGSNISSLSLDITKFYYIELRATHATAGTSTSISSTSFLPGSDNCTQGMVAASPFAGGTGTYADPYTLCSGAQFAEIQNSTTYLNKTFKLLAHLDLSGMTTTGIATASQPFTGRIIGNNKSLNDLTISTTLNEGVALFKKMSYAHISNLSLNNFSVTANNSSKSAALAAEFEESTASNITINNVSISGKSNVGSLIGIMHDGLVYNITATGSVTGSVYSTGGVIGGARGMGLNVNSTVNVSTGGSQVGGFIGGDYSNTFYGQNININANVSGITVVGGLVGAQNDGLYIFDGQFNGTITATTSSAGGAIGDVYNNNCNLRRIQINSNINGNSSVGGMIGYLAYPCNIYDSFYKGTITATGGSQDNIGGFFGYISSPTDVYRSYAVATINTSADKVGGLVGFVDYFNLANDVYNSFFVTDISGSSSNNTINLWEGSNTDAAIVGSGSYIYASSSCSNTGTGSCGANSINSTATLSDFYDNTKAPLNTWNFTDTWQANAGDYPSLRAYHVNSPSISPSCTASSLGSLDYTCTIAITDSDVDEMQAIVLADDNECSWVGVRIVGHQEYNSMRVHGFPPIDEEGSCTLKFYATDGVNNSSTYSVVLTMHKGVSISNLSSYWEIDHRTGFWYSFQTVAGGPKDQTYTITNNESGVITGLSISSMALPFLYKDGTYPGTGGDCDGDLNPGESCDIVISFDPSSVGTFKGEWNINYTGPNGAVSYPIAYGGYGN